MAKCISIARAVPRPGGEEYAVVSKKGYQLVAPGIKSKNRTKAVNATFVESLDDALALLDRGYHIRMGRAGIQPSLICKASLRIEMA